MSTVKLAFLLVSVWILAVFIFPVVVLSSKNSDEVRAIGVCINDNENPFECYIASDRTKLKAEYTYDRLSLGIEWKRSTDTKYYLPKVESHYKLKTVILSARMEEPKLRSGEIKPVLFFCGKDGQWFENIGCAISCNKWTQIKFDVSASSSSMRPQRGSGCWDICSKYCCDTWGFMFTSHTMENCSIFVEPARVVFEEDELEARLSSFSFISKKPEQYELFEFSFQVSPIPENPFDPEQADIQAEFIAPSGSKTRSFAFFTRPYSRAIEAESEVMTPQGQSFWAVRFAPSEDGEYKCQLLGKVCGISIPSHSFTFAVLPSKNRGFVRVSKDDTTRLVFDNSEEFYPIGHSFRSPIDKRLFSAFKVNWLPDHGTFKYDMVLEKMAGAGENFVEFWLSSWFSGLEWNSGWKNYDGLGRYNLANAAKVDCIINKCYDLGIYMNIVIDNHGKYSGYCDNEWEYSPYNITNGGFLKSAGEFWKSEKAQELYKKRVRYIMARWGYSANIAAFELVSELDLTGDDHNSYLELGAVDWTQMMSSYIHKIDSYQHLVSTHYCFDYRNVNAPEIAKMKGIDWIVVDGYKLSGDLPSLWVRSVKNLHEKYGKPVMITEFGGTHKGNTVSFLQSELHTGIWSGYMTNLAGTPLFWWFDAIEHEDWYFHFKALSNFAKGEKRLGAGMKTVQISKVKRGVKAIGLKNSTRGYYWVYTGETLEAYTTKPKKTVSNVKLKIKDIKDGIYSIEIWGTFEGEILEKRKVKVDGGSCYCIASSICGGYSSEV